MTHRYTYKGTKRNTYLYLTKELKISENLPRPEAVGRFRLTSLRQQLDKIYHRNDRSGNIYFTEEYQLTCDEAGVSAGYGFDICTVYVKIVD